MPRHDDVSKLAIYRQHVQRSSYTQKKQTVLINASGVHAQTRKETVCSLFVEVLVFLLVFANMCFFFGRVFLKNRWCCEPDNKDMDRALNSDPLDVFSN